jgi:hypothetical protein
LEDKVCTDAQRTHPLGVFEPNFILVCGCCGDEDDGKIAKGKMDIREGMGLDVVDGFEVLARQSHELGRRGRTGAMASSDVAFRSVREALLILGADVSGSTISSTLAILLLR